MRQRWQKWCWFIIKTVARVIYAARPPINFRPFRSNINETREMNAETLLAYPPPLTVSSSFPIQAEITSGLLQLEEKVIQCRAKLVLASNVKY